MPYNIYITKRNYDSWSQDVNEVRIWLLIEILYFFFWIFSGVIFLMYAYLFKFEAISKNEVLLSLDDNVWNDKGTDDFLRYLKFEYFMVCYLISIIAVEVFTGYTDLYHISKLGQRDWEKTGIIYAILIGARVFSLLLVFAQLKPSDNKVNDGFNST